MSAARVSKSVFREASALAVGLLLALGLLAAACRNSGSGASHQGGSVGTAARTGEVVVRAGARKLTFHVEVALTEAERQHGLMYRSRLDPESGMLFVFPLPSRLVFWMKNTLIPLDMIFIGADRRVVGVVENAEPKTETPRGVDRDAQFVLEIAGGLSRRLGIAPGAEVEFRGVPGVSAD